MRSGREDSQLVNMRGGEAVVEADLFPVQPDRGGPVNTFQEEHHPPARPGIVNLHAAAVPGGTDVVPVRLQPVGNPEVVRSGVGLEGRPGMPVLVVQGAQPGRVNRRRIAKPPLLQGARQADGVGQRPGAPIFLDADILAVEGKGPFAL